MKDIIATLFLARNVAHSLHLSTKSFAQHLALEHFYEKLVKLADSIAESYMGKHGQFSVDVINTSAPFGISDPLIFMKTFSDWATNTRALLDPADTYITNQWDELLQLANRTRYKLDNFA